MELMQGSEVLHDAQQGFESNACAESLDDDLVHLTNVAVQKRHKHGTGIASSIPLAQASEHWCSWARAQHAIAHWWAHLSPADIQQHILGAAEVCLTDDHSMAVLHAYFCMLILNADFLQHQAVMILCYSAGDCAGNIPGSH